MIKIIKEGVVKVYKGECPYCRCVFSYSRVDVREYLGNYDKLRVEIYGAIKCPTCECEVDVAVVKKGMKNE